MRLSFFPWLAGFPIPFNYGKLFVKLFKEIIQQHFSLSGYHVKINVIEKLAISACWQHRPHYK